MRREHIGGDAVVLIPATADDLRVGLSPADQNRIAVTLHVRTEVLGDFQIPLTAEQLGVITGMGNWLFKLDEAAVLELRDRMAKEMDNTDGDDQ